MKNILIFMSCFIYFSEINANEVIDKETKECIPEIKTGEEDE